MQTTDITGITWTIAGNKIDIIANTSINPDEQCFATILITDMPTDGSDPTPILTQAIVNQNT